jgi:ribosomal protein S27E
VVGALLGNEANRQITVVNSFELLLVDAAQDVSMGEADEALSIDVGFFGTRKEQCKYSQSVFTSSQTSISCSRCRRLVFDGNATKSNG